MDLTKKTTSVELDKIESERIAHIVEICKSCNLPSPQVITPYTSGQINYVYNIDGRYVIKIEGKEAYATGIFSHQEELMQRLAGVGAKIPKIIAIGEKPVKFLLMEKIEGTALVNDWPALARSQQRSFVEQIATQMKLIHSLKYKNFSTSAYTHAEFTTLAEAYNDHYRCLKVNTEGFTPELQEAFARIEDFYRTHKTLLDDPTLRPVCIHGDFHFGNIFHKDGKITGVIDWDWSAQMPKEYEFLNIVGFYYQPYKYVEESLEAKYKAPLIEEMTWFRNAYPALFAHPHLVDIVRLWHLPSFIDDFYWYEHGRWNEEVMYDVVRRMDFILGEGLKRLLHG